MPTCTILGWRLLDPDHAAALASGRHDELSLLQLLNAPVNDRYRYMR